MSAGEPERPFPPAQLAVPGRRRGRAAPVDRPRLGGRDERQPGVAQAATQVEVLAVEEVALVEAADFGERGRGGGRSRSPRATRRLERPTPADGQRGRPAPGRGGSGRARRVNRSSARSLKSAPDQVREPELAAGGALVLARVVRSRSRLGPRPRRARACSRASAGRERDRVEPRVGVQHEQRLGVPLAAPRLTAVPKPGLWAARSHRRRSRSGGRCGTAPSPLSTTVTDATPGRARARSRQRSISSVAPIRDDHDVGLHRLRPAGAAAVVPERARGRGAHHRLRRGCGSGAAADGGSGRRPPAPPGEPAARSRRQKSRSSGP